MCLMSPQKKRSEGDDIPGVKTEKQGGARRQCDVKRYGSSSLLCLSLWKHTAYFNLLNLLDMVVTPVIPAFRRLRRDRLLLI